MSLEKIDSLLKKLTETGGASAPEGADLPQPGTAWHSVANAVVVNAHAVLKDVQTAMDAEDHPAMLALIPELLADVHKVARLAQNEEIASEINMVMHFVARRARR